MASILKEKSQTEEPPSETKNIVVCVAVIAAIIYGVYYVFVVLKWKGL